MVRRAPLMLLLFVLLTGGLVASARSAPNEPTVSFSAAGDFGTSANATNVLDTIHGLGTDLTLALGDLSYGTTGQEQAWCDFVTSKLGAGYPFELISGNHEGNGQNGNINDFSVCLPNQLPGVIGTYGRQYYVDVPAGAPLVRYVMISPSIIYPDSTWSYTVGSPRYVWTQQAIDGARSAGIPWVVVGMHKPCLSVGNYSCEPGADILNLLVSKKVDLVLNGHEHLYQRTKQLALTAGCSSITPGTYNAACVVDGDATMDRGAGTVLATVGTGGQNLYNVNAADGEAQFFAVTAGANQSPTYGALKVSVTADTLSATFAKAGTGTFADSFTITRPTNQPPVAAFSSSCTNLVCGFDGSGSSDPDGTVASYAWTFGDGATGTGANPSHTYAAAGTYPVELTVTDDKGVQTALTKSVVVTAASNQPPTAAFSSSCTNLACGFDGSGSSDPDGTVASYAWTFGDGATGTGANPSHTYAAAGTYSVGLTVTDNAGATATTTKDVTVTTPVVVIARDDFARTVSNGFGTAPVGGAWTVTSTPSRYAVTGGVGTIQVPAGVGPAAYLGSVAASATDLSVKISTDKPATGSGLYVSVQGRRTSAGDYRVKVRFQANSTVALSLVRATSAGAETALTAESVIPGLTYAVGDALNVRLQVTGTSPTTVRAKVWKAGTLEPTAWSSSSTDTTAGLQAAGSVGVLTYLSSGATNGPITVRLDDLSAVAP